jgi:hypothetical protein
LHQREPDVKSRLQTIQKSLQLTTNHWPLTTHFALFTFKSARLLVKMGEHGFKILPLRNSGQTAMDEGGVEAGISAATKDVPA